MPKRNSGYAIVLDINRPLRPRSIQLLQKLAEDRSLNEAAVELHISISTANQMIATARERLGTRTTYGALVEAIRRGFVHVARPCPD